MRTIRKKIKSFITQTTYTLPNKSTRGGVYRFLFDLLSGHA